ncbi:unnamed protein product [Fusarium fujikuroi]|uniref:Uncharacterized protein n=1 Tax=Fusarium fujikuroi TaxID=5127 RepID=A0A9Q9R988_FUSFU|nr:unnamed protein product [Fusarium fujikuroi]VTT80005.1 unnamed protein product [Fusarium fujikuroi]VZI17192.1 unnamed protein product [Fusarium fujikuroi]
MSSVREHTNPRTLVWGNPEGDSLVNAAAVGVMLVNPPKSSNTELAFSEQTLLIFAIVFRGEFLAGSLYQGLDEAAEMDANNITLSGRQSWITIETAWVARIAEDMSYKKLWAMHLCSGHDPRPPPIATPPRDHSLFQIVGRASPQASTTLLGLSHLLLQTRETCPTSEAG